jgi:hypothetical protein
MNDDFDFYWLIFRIASVPIGAAIFIFSAYQLQGGWAALAALGAALFFVGLN